MANDIIQKKEQAMQNGNGGKTLKEYIKIMEPEIKKALPSTISSERFTRMLVTSVSMNPKICFLRHRIRDHLAFHKEPFCHSI